MDYHDIQQIRNAALVIGMAANLNARVAGMQAENHTCAVMNETPRYGEKDFEKVIEETGCHWNGIITNLNNG